MHKRRLYRLFKNVPSKVNWDNFRKQRNLCTDIRRRSIKHYFQERCIGGSKNDEFWKTIRPFVSNKGCNSDVDLMVEEGDKIITDPSQVANAMNEHYAHIATNIGQDQNPPDFQDSSAADFVSKSTLHYNQTSHLSIQLINKESAKCNFSFSEIDSNIMSNAIKSLNPKKATGFDGILAKFLMMACPILCYPLTKIFNACIKHSTFPDICKSADIRPIFKKADPLLKKNYRPVSILTSVSKVFEKLLEAQLQGFQDTILHSGVSAFRSGYSCQSVLLQLTERIRSDLDNGLKCGLVLMDLSKAFDCIPHHLLISKLHAYGMTTSAITLLSSYLTQRKQRIKLKGTFSDWTFISKGVPQGSVMGPMLFNFFLNDIFLYLKDANFFNYADDNSVLVSNRDVNVIKDTLQKEASMAIEWFKLNLMEVNPDKFQFILFGNSAHKKQEFLELQNVKIQCETSVKLLGVTLDLKLSFNNHINNLAAKAGAQLSALTRIKRYLDESSKLTMAKTFIFSHFKYCPVIWHFCGRNNSNKLEQIQKRALNIALKSSSSDYELLLRQASLTSLELERQKSILIEVYKTLNNLNPAYLKDLFLQVKQPHFTRNSVSGLTLPSIKSTTYGLHSVRFYGAVLWNSLPSNLQEAENLKQFRFLLQDWKGTACKCAQCKS